MYIIICYSFPIVSISLLLWIKLLWSPYTILCVNIFLFLSGKYLGVKLKDKCMLNSNCQTMLPIRYTILRSCKQCMRILVASHPHYHLVLSVKSGHLNFKLWVKTETKTIWDRNISKLKIMHKYSYCAGSCQSIITSYKWRAMPYRISIHIVKWISLELILTFLW